MSQFEHLELSGQTINQPPLEHRGGLNFTPPADTGERLAAPSEFMELPTYVFSNDELAQCADAVRLRVNTQEYSSVRRPTALLVGESALMAMLSYDELPEADIVIVDFPNVCVLMSWYICALRTETTPERWLRAIKFDDDFMEQFPQVATQLNGQLVDWSQIGPHPLIDGAAYSRAHEQALRKRFHVISTDLTEYDNVEQLAQYLRQREMTLTMCNLTNYIAANLRYDRVEPYVDLLSLLPVTSEAPILATSVLSSSVEGSEYNLALATGPFFGLDNLRATGAGTVKESADAGALVYRQSSDGHAQHAMAYAFGQIYQRLNEGHDPARYGMCRAESGGWRIVDFKAYLTQAQPYVAQLRRVK